MFFPLFQVSPFYQADFSSILNTLLRGALYTFDTRNARLRVHNEWVCLFFFFCTLVTWLYFHQYNYISAFLWFRWIFDDFVSYSQIIFRLWITVNSCLIDDWVFSNLSLTLSKENYLNDQFKKVKKLNK